MVKKEKGESPEEMDKNRKDFEEQIKSLLNDDQKTEFDNFMKKPWTTIKINNKDQMGKKELTPNKGKKEKMMLIK